MTLIQYEQIDGIDQYADKVSSVKTAKLTLTSRGEEIEHWLLDGVEMLLIAKYEDYAEWSVKYESYQWKSGFASEITP